MIIHDDGLGVDPGRLTACDGMANMRERARLLGGHIEWEHRHGTTVTLRVPLPK